ncbi:MAG: hypothetical protein ACREOZ_03585, partial [Gloeomargaritales cyanobacterium]
MNSNSDVSVDVEIQTTTGSGNADPASLDSSNDLSDDGQSASISHRLAQRIAKLDYLAVSNGDETNDQTVTDKLGNVHLDYLTSFLQAAGAKVPKHREGAKKKVEKWLDSPARERPYIFKSKAELVVLLQQHSGGSNQYSGWNAARLTSKVIEVTSTMTNHDVHLGDEKYKLLESIIVRSFMSPLTGVAKKNARLGHLLEEPLGINLLKDSDADVTPVKITALYKAGLVQKADKPWVKDSIDLIGLTEHDDEVKAIGIEIKARVAPGSNQTERNRIIQSGNLKYPVISASSDELRHFVKSPAEATQILHHAYTYDLAYVCLLVGDKKGNIMTGVFVYFSNGLKVMYGRCLDDLKVTSLQWAYDDSEMPISDFERIVRDHKRIGDVATLVGTIRLWKQMTQKMALPLPPCRRILPKQHAFWNIQKGGSDVATRLMWNNKLKPPVRTLQSIAIAQLLMLANVGIHRLLQMFSVDEKSVKSLNHYRRTANRRLTFRRSLRCIREGCVPMVQYSNIEDHVMLQRRQTQFKVMGQTASPFRCATAVTGLTPKRDAERRYGEPGQLSKEIETRRWTCIGVVPIFRTGLDGKPLAKVCVKCGTVTSWYCTGCHHFLCLQQRGGKVN